MAKKKIKEISLVEMVEIDEKNMVTEIYNIRKQENYTSNYKDYCID